MFPEKSRQIGNYHYFKDQCIGEGSFGKVYLGCPKDSPENILAIKQIQVKNQTRDIIETSCLREIDIFKEIKSRNVVKFYGSYFTKDNIYMIYEYCSEGDLDQLRKSSVQKYLSEDQTKLFMSHICNGYKVLKENNIVHRDLKPLNIFLQDREAKIGDFGSARFYDPEHLEMTRASGSPLYMSPENMSSVNYDSKCDVWSFGVMIFELLYGKTPWSGKTMVELHENIIKKPLKFPNLPKRSVQIQKLIENMLVVDPEKRIGWDQVFKAVDDLGSKKIKIERIIAIKPVVGALHALDEKDILDLDKAKKEKEQRKNKGERNHEKGIEEKNVKKKENEKQEQEEEEQEGTIRIRKKKKEEAEEEKIKTLKIRKTQKIMISDFLGDFNSTKSRSSQEFEEIKTGPEKKKMSISPKKTVSEQKKTYSERKSSAQGPFDKTQVMESDETKKRMLARKKKMDEDKVNVKMMQDEIFLARNLAGFFDICSHLMKKNRQSLELEREFKNKILQMFNNMQNDLIADAKVQLKALKKKDCLNKDEFKKLEREIIYYKLEDNNDQKGPDFSDFKKIIHELLSSKKKVFSPKKKEEVLKNYSDDFFKLFCYFFLVVQAENPMEIFKDIEDKDSSQMFYKFYDKYDQLDRDEMFDEIKNGYSVLF